jgi:acyl-CoA thioesterase-1
MMADIERASGRCSDIAPRYGGILAQINQTALFLASAVIAIAVAASAAAAPIKVMAFGDSLFAGYGVADSDNFTSQLERALKADGKDVRVINAAVSGDTTADGLARLDWSLADKPDLVLLELGANDALRGLDPDQAKANLDQILGKLTAAHVPVVICGMLAPRNLGPAYAAKFDPMYKELADKYHAHLYPFVLDGVALDPSLNQADGMHPNPKGVVVIVKKMLPVVEKSLPGTG